MKRKRTHFYARTSFLFALLISTGALSMTVGQTKVTWHAEFTLTIKGSGELKGQFDGDPDINWKVDRTYYSNFTMLGPPLPRNLKTAALKVSNTFTRRDPLTVNVKVADELKIKKANRYQHDTPETVTDITRWEQDANESGAAIGFTFSIVNGTYSIGGIVVPESRAKNLKITKSRVYDRGPVGFGGRPTHEEITEKPIFVEVESLTTPRVVGDLSLASVMGTPAISTPASVQVPATFPPEIKFDSKDLQPDSPLIEGIPDSKTNLKIRWVVRISRTPFY